MWFVPTGGIKEYPNHFKKQWKSNENSIVIIKINNIYFCEKILLKIN